MSRKTETIIKLPEGSFLGVEREEIDAATYANQTLYRVVIKFGAYELSNKTFLSGPSELGLKTIEAATLAMQEASTQINHETQVIIELMKSHVRIMSEKLRRERS